MRLNKRKFTQSVTLKKSLPAYVFLFPWIVGVILFRSIPLFTSLYYSFTDFKLFSSPSFIGLKNYEFMFTIDGHYFNAIKATFTYVFIGVPLQLIWALILALLLDKNMRALPIFRSIYYIPSLLGSSVAISMLWLQFFGSKGMFNKVLEFFNITTFGQFPWISNPNTSIYTLVLLLVWQFGSPMLIFLAGLKQIPAELVEAAKIDGAGRSQIFRHVTLPVLSPIIFFNLIMQIIHAFKAFTPAYIVSGGSGGALGSVMFYTLYIYKSAFTDFRMGYASALGWILIIIIVVFVVIIFKTSKWVHYAD